MWKKERKATAAYVITIFSEMQEMFQTIPEMLTQKKKKENEKSLMKKKHDYY